MFLEKAMKISRTVLVVSVIACLGIGVGAYNKFAKAETLEDVLSEIEIEDVKTREQIEQEQKMSEEEKMQAEKKSEREKIYKLIEGKDAENIIFMDLKDGRVVIELLPDLAPGHVYRIKKLTREGFYNGLKFHRVIEGFMAQTGDPKGNGTGGSYMGDMKAEFNNEPHVRGAVSMARAFDPNSANSQFFIVYKDARFLDGKYTLFGRVIYGMNHIDNIKKGDQRQNGAVENPDIIVRMTVAKDLTPDEDEKRLKEFEQKMNKSMTPARRDKNLPSRSGTRSPMHNRRSTY